MATYAEIIENKFNLESLSIGGKYEILKTEPNYYHRNGEPYVINDNGQMDFCFKILCELKYHRVV